MQEPNIINVDFIGISSEEIPLRLVNKKGLVVYSVLFCPRPNSHGYHKDSTLFLGQPRIKKRETHIGGNDIRKID